MIVSDVARRVRARMGDVGATQLQDVDFIDICNDSQIAINREAKVLRGTSAANTVAGTALYALPADYIAPKSMLFTASGVSKRMQQIAIEELNDVDAYRDNSSARGVPTIYFVDGSNLGFYPTPDSAYAYSFEYIKLPTTLNAVGDVLTLPTYMHPAVVTYAMAIAKEVDEDWDSAERIRNRAIMEAIDLAAMSRNEMGESYAAVREWDAKMPTGLWGNG